MMEKIIVLNSGGFDSVTLLHFVKENNPNAEITSLFFNYGQRNLSMEREKSRKVAEKLDVKHIEIDLPKFSWSNSSLYNQSDNQYEIKSQYLEMRNLIFISYALSLAEHLKATKIYMAMLKGGIYTDSNSDFIKTTKDYIKKILNIDFETPFSDLDKVEVAYFTKAFKVDFFNDFFSCNTPIDDGRGNLIPCGKCGDCEELKLIYNSLYKKELPINEWVSNDLYPSENFYKMFKEEPINELRLLITNNLKSKQLNLDELKKTIDEAVKLKIKNIHFSEKEPTINKDIFKVIDYIKKKNYPLTYSILTNEVNILKYEKEIKEAGFKRVNLNVDSLNLLSNKHLLDSINFLTTNEIPLQIIINTHTENYKKVNDIILNLFKNGVTDFYVRTLTPLYNNSHNLKILGIKELDKLYKDLDILTDNLTNIKVELKINTVWVRELLENVELEDNNALELSKTLIYVILSNGNKYLKENFLFYPEFYCDRYENKITLTPDGYLLGCETEVYSKYYDKISAGNIREKSLKELIEIGKEQQVNMIKRNVEMNGFYKIPPCFHNYYNVKGL